MSASLIEMDRQEAARQLLLLTAELSKLLAKAPTRMTRIMVSSSEKLAYSRNTKERLQALTALRAGATRVAGSLEGWARDIKPETLDINRAREILVVIDQALQAFTKVPARV